MGYFADYGGLLLARRKEGHQSGEPDEQRQQVGNSEEKRKCQYQYSEDPGQLFGNWQF